MASSALLVSLGFSILVIHSALQQISLVRKDPTESITFHDLCVRDRSNKSFARFADKDGVKDYVRSLNAGVEIPKTLFTVKSESEITMDKLAKLPSRFVMKATHGSGMTVVANEDDYGCHGLFCVSKLPESRTKYAHIQFLKDTCKKWLGTDFSEIAGELFYHEITPQCIFEEFLAQHSDYKVFTFHGTPMMIQVTADTFSGDETLTYYTPSWHVIPMRYHPQNFPIKVIAKPPHLSQLLKAAQVLGAGFPFVRTDFYINDGKVTFSELTKCHCACIGSFPDTVEQFFGHIESTPSAHRVPDDILELLKGHSQNSQAATSPPPGILLEGGSVWDPANLPDS